MAVQQGISTFASLASCLRRGQDLQKDVLSISHDVASGYGGIVIIVLERHFELGYIYFANFPGFGRQDHDREFL